MKFKDKTKKLKIFKKVHIISKIICFLNFMHKIVHYIIFVHKIVHKIIYIVHYINFCAKIVHKIVHIENRQRPSVGFIPEVKTSEVYTWLIILPAVSMTLAS